MRRLEEGYAAPATPTEADVRTLRNVARRPPQ
jgi:hypothetical protein